MKTSLTEYYDEKTAKELIVKNGQITSINGLSITTYLNKWIKAQKIKDGTFLSIIIRNDFIELLCIEHTYNTLMNYNTCCSFCRITNKDTETPLVATANAAICEECLNIAQEIFQQKENKNYEKTTK